MSYFERLKQCYGKLLLVGTAGVLSGFAAGTLANTQEQMIVVSLKDAKFEPADPANPEGPQLAVLSGDPTKGPAAVLLKLKKGIQPLHSHTSDHHAVLIQGTAKHWAEGEREADVKSLGPGSYWFQPGKQVHGDACTAENGECLVFVNFMGKMDSILAEAPRK
jgi:quercetin dioxygenase-like cupin family protein